MYNNWYVSYVVMKSRQSNRILVANCSESLKDTQKDLRFVIESLFRKFDNHLGNETRKQIVVLETTMAKIIRKKQGDPTQWHTGSSKMLNALCQRYYPPNLAIQN